MKIKVLEKDIQKQIIQWLKWQKDIYFIRNNSFAGKIVRPNGSCGWVNNAKRGSPDVVLLKDGQFIGLEIKTKQGRISDAQREAQKAIQACGGQYYVVRNLEEVINILE